MYSVIRRGKINVDSISENNDAEDKVNKRALHIHYVYPFCVYTENGMLVG